MLSSATSAQRLTIGKLAQLADVSANAVRFYEREGLMQVPAKTDSGYRLYGPEAVDRLRFIKQAQHCGFTLSQIQALLQLRDEASSCCNDVRGRVIEKKLELEARIKAMRTMSKALDQLIADCSAGTRPVEDCSILAALSGGEGALMKVEVLHSGNCAKCQRNLPGLRAAALAVDPEVDWREIDIAQAIDYAVELGVMKPPAVAIDGELAFPSLPTANELTAAMRARLRS